MSKTKSNTKQAPKRVRATVGDKKKTVETDRVKSIVENSEYDTERRFVCVANTSEFQVQADRVEVINGTPVYKPEITIKFTNGVKYLEEGSEELEIIQKILDGKWSDGRVTPQVFMTNARYAGLQLFRTGLAEPPMPSWDKIASDKVVKIAMNAGLLETEADFVKALRYEKESPEREPAREPRVEVVSELEGELLKLRHTGNDGEEVAAPASAIIDLPSTIVVGE